MISGALDFIFGSALQLLLLLLGLLPTIDISSLPIVPPESVVNVLGFLNMFIPIADLITIITVWIGVLIAVNVVLAISNLVQSFK